MEFNPSPPAYRPTNDVRRWHETPLVLATEDSLRGYGRLVDEPTPFLIEVVRWPAQGTRPVDQNSCDQGGVTEGTFEFWWRNETLHARNNACGDSYLFGWGRWPEEAGNGPPVPRERALIWRANCHPDGSQLVPPQRLYPFVVPFALPGDDVTPDRFVTFYCDGTRGLYIHPNVWHGAFAPIDNHAEFLDRQGRVHDRISVNFPKEFGRYLASPLRRLSA